MFKRVSVYIFLSFFCFSYFSASAYSQQPYFIRDTELETLLRDYASPILRAAGETHQTTKIFIVAHDSINAFVAGGRRIFMHTGLILKAKTPNQVIGVIAHEVGHIESGHLSTLQAELDRANAAAIIGMLAGVAATAAGAASNNAEIARSGSGIMLGSGELARRLFFSYRRAQESTADQAAVRYLNATGQSARGMLEFFEDLAGRSIGSLRNSNPYTRSHPVAFDRLRNLETIAKESRHFDVKDSPALVLRHRMAQAKLLGFLSTDKALRQFRGKSDIASRYGYAIATFRRGRINDSLKLIETLLRDQPNNPYFWEVKGQALFENGRVGDSIPALKKSLRLAPEADLIRILLGQALVAEGLYGEAVRHLQRAARREGDSPLLHYQLALAYGNMGKTALADLSTAERLVLLGDLELAKRKAAQAQKKLKRGSPHWQRAQDIINLRER